MRAKHGVLTVLAAVVVGCGGGTDASKGATHPPSQSTTTAASTPSEVTNPTPAEQKPSETAPPKASEVLDKTLRLVADAQRSRDAKKMAALYAEDAELTLPGPTGRATLSGRDAVEKSYQETYDGMTNTKFGFSRVWRSTAGDFAACEWVTTFKHAGMLLGMKATDRLAGATGMSLVWLTPEGLVKKEHRYFDTATIAGQVGFSKAKVRPVMVNVAQSWETVASKESESTQSLDLLKGIYAAFEKKDEAAFLGALSDNTVHEDYMEAEASRGKDAAKTQFTAFAKAFDGIKIKVENGWAFGDWAIAEVTAESTTKAPNGAKKNLKVSSVDVAKVNKDGKVQQVWTYGDQTDVLLQLGVLKPPAPPKPEPAKKADTKKPDAKK